MGTNLDLYVLLKAKDMASKTIKGVSKEVSGLRGAAAKVGPALRTAAIGAAAIGTTIVAANIRSGIQSLAELESATTSVQGAIEQMGLAGQITSAQVADWANEIEADVDAAFDDKAITAAAAGLIRYGKVTQKTLRPAMEVMTDLAARTGDVKSAGELLAKALADPTRAAGKLSRYGVILTKTQQDQIKAMVKAGKTAEAQALLLDILAESTKGAAKASAGPYQDAMNKMADAVEDAQRALAVGFLPVIQEVADWLSKELVKPSTIKAIKDFGTGLAGGLREAVKWARSLPWDQITAGLKSAAGFAKTLFDAFMSMPTEVKGLLIGLAGLNKLSGGAVGSIVGELGKGLIKGVMNVAHITLNAASVTGTGLGGGAAPAGGATSKLGKVAGIAKVFVAGMAVAAAGVLADQLMQQSAEIRQMGDDLKEQAGDWVDSDATSRQQIVDAINRIDEQMANPLNALALEVTNGLNGGKDAILQTKAALTNKLAILDGRGTALQRTFGSVGGMLDGGLNDVQRAVAMTAAGVGRVYGAQQAVRSVTSAGLATVRAAVTGVRSAVATDTAVLRAKNFSPRISVNTRTVVSVRAVTSGQSTVSAYSSSKPVLR